MLLYLSIAIILMLLPYPVQVRRLALYLCLVLAALFGVGGVRVLLTYHADGFLLGGTFLILGAGFLIRAYRMKRHVSLAN